jgi:hypothetical protein
VDEDNFIRYLPMFVESGQPIYVERDSPLLSRLGEAPLRFEEIPERQLADLAAQCTTVMHF